MSAAEHATDAKACIAESSEFQSWTIEERLIFANRAQASATLALVAEQRTANLIAMWRDGAIEPGAPGLHYGTLLKRIKDRLELA